MVLVANVKNKASMGYTPIEAFFIYLSMYLCIYVSMYLSTIILIAPFGSQGTFQFALQQFSTHQLNMHKSTL